MATPRRSTSIDALRRNALTVWPGTTIYWIGDLSHQGTVSGHNPDDYTGVQAEMLDDDTISEVRALDIMVGPNFTTQDGWNLVNALTKGSDKSRLYYVIYRSTIWRRATGFQAEAYGGNNHNSHVHVSGHVSDDNNGADWQSVLALEEPMTVAELHALLLSILTADTSAERQARDMIMGGVQSPAGGTGLLTPVRDVISALQADVDALQAEVTALRAVADATKAAVDTIGTSNPDVAAILAGIDERLATLRTSVESDTRDAVADLAESGSGAVRADADDPIGG